MPSTGEAYAPAAYRDFVTTERFGSLDGLRAVSVVGTVWHHAVGGTGVLAAGALGVHMFFAISGFLITTLLLREWQRIGKIDLRSFYVRRTLRIFPAYYLTLTLYVLLASTLMRATGNAQRFIELLPAFATYTANWFYTPAPGVTLFVHGWSLSTEEQFYLLWPPLLLVALRTRRPLMVAAGVVATLIVADVFLPRIIEEGFVRTVISSLALPICGGVLLAVMLHSRSGFYLFWPLLGRRLSAPAALVLAAMAVALGASWELISAGLVLIVATCVIREDHGISWCLCVRPLVALGRVSYGVYLYHLIVLLMLALAIGRYVSPAGLALTTLAVTYVFARVSFTFFEEPLRRLGRRRPSPVAGTPVAVSGA